MNWLDRAIAAVAPRAGLRRAAARRALRFVENGGQRSVDFDRNTGKVADALPIRAVARERIRNLIATNPYARKAVNTLLNNLIGYGITGTPRKTAPKKVVNEWKRWLRRSDWVGRLDFYGQQELALSAMLVDGECFIVRRFEADGGLVPTRLELLDVGMVAEWKGTDGIDYDDRGRPLRYWFKKERLPKTGLSGEAVSFAAAEVIHLFRQDWIGQLRGRSMFEPAIKRLEDVDGYLEAETVRKQIEACFAAFITPSLDSDEAFGTKDGTATASGLETETLEPGMLTRLRPGETVTFGTPRVTAGVLEFVRVSLLATTAGVGIPYEQGSGDLSNVNYSSYKAGSLEFERFCGRLQWLLIIPVALERIWRWFLDDGFAVGLFNRTDYEIAWTPAAFESIDKQKDVKGEVAEMEAGLTTRRRLLSARGEDHDETIDEIRTDKVTQGDLIFAGDPTTAGQQSNGGAGNEANAST